MFLDMKISSMISLLFSCNRVVPGAKPNQQDFIRNNN